MLVGVKPDTEQLGNFTRQKFEQTLRVRANANVIESDSFTAAP